MRQHVMVGTRASDVPRWPGHLWASASLLNDLSSGEGPDPGAASRTVRYGERIGYREPPRLFANEYLRAASVALFLLQAVRVHDRSAEPCC
jgi:hypothetical protein